MTASPLKLADSHPGLCEAIAQRIANSTQQRITFAEFMDLALYHPEYGYYAHSQEIAHSQGRQDRQGGIQSDFFTSPHLGADFGELLAEQFAQMWNLLDRPQPFTLVEMGAGQGLIVQDILRYLHRHHFECFEALEYIVIEKSSAMVAVQQQRLQRLTDSWGHLSWKTWDEILPNSLVGCCFSNELVDAFPVHRVAIANGILQEIYVAGEPNSGEPNSGEPFIEVIAELSTPKLAEYFDLVELKFSADSYPNPYRSEVNLAALDWMTTVADRLKTGYLLTIDYGYSAQRYYSPTRSEGTLQCYYQHAHHSDPYRAIGRQDITAHVNFTALEKQGDRCGLQKIGFTQQGLFLMALGLGDRIAGLSETGEERSLQVTSLQDILRRRESLHALINPIGLGSFGVLVQSKGLNPSISPPLKGLTTPPLF